MSSLTAPQANANPECAIPTLQATAAMLLPGMQHARSLLEVSIRVLEYFERHAALDAAGGKLTELPKAEPSLVAEAEKVKALLPAFGRCKRHLYNFTRPSGRAGTRSDQVLREQCPPTVTPETAGPADLHNANRPRPGRNGYELTVAGIERIRSRLGVDRVSALMTTTDRSLARPRDIIDEYVRQGFNSIFLRPLSPYGFAVTTGQVDRYNTDRWLEFFKEGLRYILELNHKGVPIRETYSSIVLRKMLTPASTGYVDLQSPAGIGIGGIVYNYDGAVYASDEARMLAEMGDTSFRLGHLGTNSYDELMLSDQLLDPLEASLAESAPGCSDCAFLPYCGSNPVYHHATQGDVVGNKALSGFCMRNMAVFRHLISLMEDCPRDRKVLERWAL